MIRYWQHLTEGLDARWATRSITFGGGFEQAHLGFHVGYGVIIL